MEKTYIEINDLLLDYMNNNVIDVEKTKEVFESIKESELSYEEKRQLLEDFSLVIEKISFNALSLKKLFNEATSLLELNDEVIDLENEIIDIIESLGGVVK